MEMWEAIARESIRDLVYRYNANGDTGRTGREKGYGGGMHGGAVGCDRCDRRDQQVTEVLPGDDLFAVGDPSDPAAELAAGVIAEAGDGTTTGSRPSSTTFASLRHRNF